MSEEFFLVEVESARHLLPGEVERHSGGSRFGRISREKLEQSIRDTTTGLKSIIQQVDTALGEMRMAEVSFSFTVTIEGDLAFLSTAGTSSVTLVFRREPSPEMRTGPQPPPRMQGVPGRGPNDQ